MKILLDTHMLLALGQGTLNSKYPAHAELIQSNEGSLFGSVASLWEMNIKIGIGKLELGATAFEFAKYLEQLGIIWLGIHVEHASAVLDQVPDTRDPFDRMLLAQCQVEDMNLVTVDRLLADHPLTAKV